jgi:hypothetical protein
MQKILDEIKEIKENLIREIKEGLYSEQFNELEFYSDNEVWNEVQLYELDGIENLIHDIGYINGLESALHLMNLKNIGE